MKRILIALCALPFFWSGVSTAQEGEAPNVTGVELFMCNYNKGKGPKDLDRVVEKWNAWADEAGMVPYVAWTLTPMFNDPKYAFDVAWLGAWANGADMGKGIQQWKDKGGAMQVEFDKVLTCPGHSAFNAANYKAPQGDWPPTGVTVFTDCTIAEGKTLDDSIAVHGAWARHLADSGSKAGMWAFYPAFGGGDIDFNYKIVMSHSDYESLGADNNSFTNGGGWRKGQELAQGVVSCDVPRVYDSVLRRNGGVDVN